MVSACPFVQEILYGHYSLQCEACLLSGSFGGLSLGSFNGSFAFHRVPYHWVCINSLHAKLHSSCITNFYRLHLSGAG